MLRAFFSCALFLSAARATFAQDDGKPATDPDAAQTVVEADPPHATLPDLEPIMAEVTEIRGLPFITSVPAAQQSMDDFKRIMMEEIEKEYGDGEEFDLIVDGLMRLGLLKERIALDEAFVSAFAAQAAAYYDPETGQFFYLYADAPIEELNTYAAHELVHALQDQHFDLDDVEEELLGAGDTENGPRNDDYILAVRCLIEGEATYVMNIFSMKGQAGGDMMTDAMAKMTLSQMTGLSQLALDAEAVDGEMAEALEAMDELPGYILGPLFTAYTSGAGFAKHLYVEGGWEAVAAAWANRPPSTELCLHPEKYTANHVDLPTTLTLPEFAYLEEAGWRLIDSAIHGEFYLDMLLRQHGVSDEDARRASYGWDGDVYQAWKNEAGDVAIILATTWDRERDAEQFFEAYVLACDARYLSATIPDSEDQDEVVFECGAGLGTGRVTRSGREVFAIEGFDAGTTRRIGEDLGTMPIERITTVPRAEAFPNQPGAAPAGAEAEAETIALDGFSFTPGAGWQRVEPGSPMRVAQYDLAAAQGDSEPAQLVIFYFGDGHGGSYEANLERWKSQFADTAEPVVGMFDEGGVTVRTFEIAGRYIAETAPGSGVRLDKPDFRMIAAVIESAPGPYYLKVVGPRATMDEWDDSIRAMIQSVRDR